MQLWVSRADKCCCAVSYYGATKGKLLKGVGKLCGLLQRFCSSAMIPKLKVYYKK